MVMNHERTWPERIRLQIVAIMVRHNDSRRTIFFCKAVLQGKRADHTNKKESVQQEEEEKKKKLQGRQCLAPFNAHVKKKNFLLQFLHPYHFSKETDGATGWNSHLLHPTTHKNPCLCPPQAAESSAGPHHHLRRVHGPSHREVWWTTSHRMWLRCTILSSKLKRLAPVSC